MSGHNYRGAIALFLLLVIFSGSAIYLQKEHILIPERSPSNEIRLGLLPSGKYAQTVTFGYDTMAAHWLWLRAIVSFGGLWESAARDYRPILHLFDVITDLEPRFVEAYHFGAMVIGEDAHEPERALELIDKGILKNQRRFHSLPLLGFFQNVMASRTDRDFQKGKYYLALILKCRDCPDYIKTWEQYIDKEQGLYRLAFEGYLNYYLTELDNDNEMMYEMRKKSAMDCINLWGLDLLTNALAAFKEQEGRIPEDLDELLLHEVYAGQELYYWSFIELEIERTRQPGEPLLPHRDRILANSLVTGKFPPENAYDRNGGVNGFILANHFEEVREYHKLRERVDNFLNGAVIDEKTGLRDETGLRNTLKRYYEEYQIYPAKLMDIPGMTNADGSPLYPEPFKGEWNYNPLTGEVKSWGFPEL